MRYRRLREQLQQQNWMAVVVDLVIVVVGVFIGIQVANWNEDRVTQRKAAVFTERLKADLRLRIADLETRLVDLTSNNRDIMEHLRAIAGESP